MVFDWGIVKTAGTPSPHPCPLFEKSGAKTLTVKPHFMRFY